MSSIPGDFGRRVKCPCCANPWDQTGTESLVGEISCGPCFADNKGKSGLDPQNFDLTISPRENFYNFSNGGWKKNNPIPGEYANWNTFIQLRDLNLDRVKSILEELLVTTAGASGSSNEQEKLANFYRCAMDEESIEAIQLRHLDGALAPCLLGALTSDSTAAVAKLHSKFGVRVFFGMYSSPDKKNAAHSLCTVTQSGLGMPDRDYYFDEDKADKRLKYREYVSSLFELLGKCGAGGGGSLAAAAACYADKQQCDSAADAVIALETSLAEAHLTRTASRDPELTYNKMSIDLLAAKTKPVGDWGAYLTGKLLPPVGGWDWSRYFSLIGKDATAMDEINVSAVEAMKRVGGVLQQYSTNSALSHYACFHVLNSCAPHLPAAFVTTHFAFHETVLKGTAELRPRWKRALEALEDALGEALGQLYVQEYFGGEAKPRALRIVEQVRDALRERLTEVVWMSESSRVEALKKMEAFKVKIGFPDKWVDYSAMAVGGGAGDHLLNVFAGRAFSFELELTRMNTPTDRGRWHMTPQTINAYYHPSLNEIVFPAAILQAPFFDAAADDAVNFGSMGAVVGHEMTHAFDDQGRKYDSEGCMRDWWTAVDGEEYERRAQVRAVEKHHHTSNHEKKNQTSKPSSPITHNHHHSSPLITTHHHSSPLIINRCR